MSEVLSGVNCPLEWAIWKLPVYIWHLKVKVALYRSISQGTGEESVAMAV